MKTIRGLLDEKGYAIWSTTPDSFVFDALKLMAEKNVGALIVLDDEKLVGIISERDYARKVILKGKSSHKILVKDIMTYNVITVSPTHTVQESLKLMSDKHLRHLPVVENNQLIGIVTIGDLVNAIIAEQQVLINRLEHHILEHKSIT
jgi:CBS domain-containing protein